MYMGMFFYLLFKYISVSYHEAGCVRIQLTGLTPPHFRACPNPGPGFPSSYVLVFLMFNYYLFCWYWWNCWPSLFKRSFYRKRRMSGFRVDIFFY